MAFVALALVLLAGSGLLPSWAWCAGAQRPAHWCTLCAAWEQPSLSGLSQATGQMHTHTSAG